MDNHHSRTLAEPEHWLDLYGDELYRYALLQLHDASQAEDMVQETLLAALQGKDRYTGSATVITWLTGILKHKIIDHVRKQIRESPHNDLDEQLDETLHNEATDKLFDARGHWIVMPQDWGNPEKCLQQNHFQDVMRLCLARLNTLQSAVFSLREISGLNNEEICKELAITATNYWVLLYRARMGLRQCLEINWFDRSRKG